MQETHQYLATVPFDIYELHLLNLVAAHGSFTKAAAAAGLTQSAITRQVQGVESRLGLALFERTTRQVVATDAGWITRNALLELGIGDLTLRDQDNAEILVRLCGWLAEKSRPR